MAKCRSLHDENEELGKMISSGKIAKLESGLAMHKNYSEALNKSQSEVEEVVNEIEETVEGFQNTIYYLQQQLKHCKDRCHQLEQIIHNCNGHCKNQLVLDTATNDNGNDDGQQQIQTSMQITTQIELNGCVNKF